jgi:hypothetical protein
VSDPKPDLIAILDQAKAGMSSMAEVLIEFRTALVDGGFTSDEAAAICVPWALTSLGVPPPRPSIGDILGGLH